MALLQLLVTIDLMALHVAVGESLVQVIGEPELHRDAVVAREVLLLFVEVDTLAAKVCKLGLDLPFFFQGALLSGPELLGITCLVGLGASSLVGLGASRLLALGGSSLLLLLDRGRHGLSLLSDRVRMDVPHELP